MTPIRASYEILSAKELSMRQLTTDYGLAVLENFNAGPVDSAYDRLNGRWHDHQNNLTKSVLCIADALKAIREAFEAAESQLTDALSPAQPAPSAPGSTP